MLRHFSLSIKSEFDLILRSCSRRALFWRRFYKKNDSIYVLSDPDEENVLFYLVRHFSLI